MRGMYDPNRLSADDLGDFPDIVCLSHLRWKFVFQRPQHLMVRFARNRRVYFVEEPVFEDIEAPTVSVDMHDGVSVVVPRLPRGFDERQSIEAQRAALEDLIAREQLSRFVLWYYTPMALRFTDYLTPAAIVYDCMDELSAFKGAPADAAAARARAAGARRPGPHRRPVALRGEEGAAPQHPSVPEQRRRRALRARRAAAPPNPADQARICRTRGSASSACIDERLDLRAARRRRRRPAGLAARHGRPGRRRSTRPMLPRRPNIHYLGAKSYAELPRYIAGWDVALLPFARNDATRFISPTKTPEYLAAGKPVVSTSIRDVVRPYGEQRAGAHRRHGADVRPGLRGGAAASRTTRRQARADAFLRGMSWDATWRRADALLADAHRVRRTDPRRASPPCAPRRLRRCTCSITWSSARGSPEPPSRSVWPITPASAS